jgi:hypothetical protein
MVRNLSALASDIGVIQLARHMLHHKILALPGFTCRDRTCSYLQHPLGRLAWCKCTQVQSECFFQSLALCSGERSGIGAMPR